jgi:hypothetical protein
MVVTCLAFVEYTLFPVTVKGALDSQVIKFTSYLPMVGGSLRVLQLLSHFKTGRHDIAEILLKVALKHQKSISQSNMLSRALLEWPPGPRQHIGNSCRYISVILL